MDELVVAFFFCVLGTVNDNDQFFDKNLHLFFRNLLFTGKNMFDFL